MDDRSRLMWAGPRRAALPAGAMAIAASLLAVGPAFAGGGTQYYCRVKVPDEIIEGPTTGLEGATYEAEYLVEPEHIKEGAEV